MHAMALTLTRLILMVLPVSQILKDPRDHGVLDGKKVWISVLETDRSNGGVGDERGFRDHWLEIAVVDVVFGCH